MLCSICFNDIDPVGDWTYGSNAAPVNYGRCCSKCDNAIVIPARINMIRQKVTLPAQRAMMIEQYEELRKILKPEENPTALTN